MKFEGKKKKRKKLAKSGQKAGKKRTKSGAKNERISLKKFREKCD
jgi:hypothetical protein